MPRDKMTIVHKIIFSGPVGSGKSTAIKTISETPVIQTESKTTDISRELKNQTTVAMDYGTLVLNNEKIHMYGTPGQDRFNFMWEILTKGGNGLVILIDASRESAIEDMNTYLEGFSHFVSEAAVVIGLTRTDVHQRYKLEDFRDSLISVGAMYPVIEVDAREPTDVLHVINTLLNCA